MMGIVCAADMEITEVKAYVNDDRQSSVDEDGGNMYIEPYDAVNYIVTVENYLNVSGKIKLKLTVNNIDNGNDIIKELDWSDIDSEDDKSKILSFVVPEDVDYDNFNIDIRLTYKFNDTEYVTTLNDYEVTVRKSTSSINLEESFNNLTLQCTKVTAGLDTCFGYINGTQGLNNDLSTCKGTLGTCESNYNNYVQKFNDCENVRVSSEAQVASLSGRITQQDCQDLYVDPAVKDEQDTRNNLIAVVAFICIAGFAYYKYRQKNGNVDSAYMNR